MSNLNDQTSSDQKTNLIEEKFEHALKKLEQATPLVKMNAQGPVLDLTARLMVQPDGIQKLYSYIARLDSAGVFTGTDWDEPSTLLPGLVRQTLEHGEKGTVVLDCLSHLRMLAIARGSCFRQGSTDEQAQHFLTQVLALNLDQQFGSGNETMRIRLGVLGDAITRLYQFILDQVGYENILAKLVDETWRILAQRPIQVNHIKEMISQIARVLTDSTSDIGEARLGASRLVSALFSPTQGCMDDPGLPIYTERLQAMDNAALQQEAYGFARAMHDVGLVSDYHTILLKWLLENEHTQLIPDVLGLSSTGLDVLRSYQGLIHQLIYKAIFPQTAQTIYGLTMLLENGTLYAPAIAPSLWRQINLQLSEQTATSLTTAFGDDLPASTYLLAGVLLLLGQPLSVGQGNNPTCQSARALSMWAYNDPDFLMHLITQAARYDNILMHFEGKPIESKNLTVGMSHTLPLDTDPVSLILVPHLDRIYIEMGRLCADRGEDPHRWINPEFHGWWVGRDFVIAVDITSGALKNYDAFLKKFYRSYHPFYNGNQPVIHPQPAGLAVTDSSAQFVGWHAITLIRAAMDQESVMRMYFYNPNNDSGQHWGHGVIVSTQGCGERYGEASLPFEQLASRLYIFHDDPVEEALKSPIPAEELNEVKAMALSSWAAGRAVL